jgi:hypothetical protein
MFGLSNGKLPNLQDTRQEAPTPSGLLPEGVEEPKYVLRGNKVQCPVEGRTFSTRAMYVNHFEKRHM